MVPLTVAQPQSVSVVTIGLPTVAGTARMAWVAAAVGVTLKMTLLVREDQVS